MFEQFIIDIDRAKSISKNLNLSDIKILFHLVDHLDLSGVVVLTAKKKREVYLELGMTRQTFSNSLTSLYNKEFLGYSEGKTYYKKGGLCLK